MKIFSTLVFCCAVAILLSSCTTTSNVRSQDAKIYLVNGVEVPIAKYTQPPKGEDVVLKHKIVSTYTSNREEYTGVVKWTQQELVVSATSEIGRIFTARLSADDEITQSASTLLPEVARENMQYALWDIELMFFPLESITQALPEEARIEDSNEDGKRVRKLFFKDELVVLINFSDAQNPMFSETVTFKNFVRNYEYTMTLLP